MHDFIQLYVLKKTPTERFEDGNLMGKFVLVKYQNRCFRAVVRGCEKDGKKALVRLIDYGNDVFISFNE